MTEEASPELAAFARGLSELENCAVEVLGYDASQAPSIALKFADGSTLWADYWRLIRDGKARLSSFDHGQKYGLATPIDAVRELARELRGKPVVKAWLDHRTGDLLFDLPDRIYLQILNFTGYEVWEMRFRDGTGGFSNYV